MTMFHLGWFLGSGVTIQGWNEPGYPADYDWTKPALFQDTIRALERACFDLMILEDSSTIPDAHGASRDYYLRNAVMTPKFDPVPLVGYLAGVTKSIGIAPTLTSTFYPPFLLARLMSTLDHFTGGRVGWNIVTASNDRAGQNYGLPGQPEHDLRYDMADEYIDVVTRLWQSWEPDALVMDPHSGLFADPAKVHTVDFEGRFYKSRGPLNVPPSPQGRPVFVAPGGSPRGRRFSGQHADIVLAGHAATVAEMKDYRDEVHRYAAGLGRDPASCKVMFICNPFIVRGAAEAEELRQEQAHARAEKIERTLASFSYMANYDFGKLDLDRPLPEIKVNGVQSLMRTFAGAGPSATLRDVLTSERNFTPIGTADGVAAQMQEAMEEIGGDGFLVAGLIKPSYVQSITEALVPALQQRKLTRTGYGHRTLRENLMEF